VALLLCVWLVVLGIRTLAEDAHRQHITDVLWTVAAAAIVMLVHDAGRAIASRFRRVESGPKAPAEALAAPQA
jgi:hypothetical protein